MGYAVKLQGTETNLRYLNLDICIDTPYYANNYARGFFGLIGNKIVAGHTNAGHFAGKYVDYLSMNYASASSASYRDRIGIKCINSNGCYVNLIRFYGESSASIWTAIETDDYYDKEIIHLNYNEMRNLTNAWRGYNGSNKTSSYNWGMIYVAGPTEYSVTI